MKSLIQKRIIPERTQSQDKMFSNQLIMWNTKVWSGHNICCLCSFLIELSRYHVTYKNCSKSSGFFQSGLRWVDGFKVTSDSFANFINLTSLTQGDEENRTCQTLLFTISNSWPISFGKDSFWSLINVLFISVNEHCAKYSLKFRGKQ